MIVACGLTPAWQRTLVFDGWQVDAVNRAVEAHACGGGKVLHVGLALHFLGAESATVALLGGPAGRLIEDELVGLGLSLRPVASSRETRTCTTVLDRSTAGMTELVENAGEAEPRELEALLEAFGEVAGRADRVVLTGSLPAGTPPDFYRRLLERTTAEAILDVRGAELVEALPLRPFLVKPNREELARTVGRELENEVAVFAAMAQIRAAGATWVVVTDGARGVQVSGPDTRLSFPTLTAPVVNPIGCGDYLAAGIAYALEGGRSVPDAVAVGIACATENVRSLSPARLDRARVEDLARTVG